MELVKYVSYMDTDQGQENHFIYGLNPKIRVMVWMWKPLSVAEVIEHAHYVEENLNLKGGNKTIFTQQPRFMGKAPSNFSRRGSLRPPPYGNRVAPRALIMGISMVTSAASPATSRTHANQGHTRGATSRRKGIRGRSPLQINPQHFV